MCKIIFNSIFRQGIKNKVFVYCINFNHTPLDSQYFEILYKMAPGSFINHNIYKHHQIKILFLILASSSLPESTLFCFKSIPQLVTEKSQQFQTGQKWAFQENVDTHNRVI